MTSFSLRGAANLVSHTEMGLLDYARPGSTSAVVASCSSAMALNRLACTGRLAAVAGPSPSCSSLATHLVAVHKATRQVGGRPRAASGSVQQQEEIAAVGTITVGQFVVQGLRDEMEDEIVVEAEGPHGFSYAAIFDGHAGVFSATFLRLVGSISWV